MAATPGTVALEVTADTTKAEESFARLRSAGIGGNRTPREAALDYAIGSLPITAGSDAIIERACTFLEFLAPG